MFIHHELFFNNEFILSMSGQDDFMNFIIMFMASPEYVRNPYLRAKMVEVLNCWMPRRCAFFFFFFFGILNILHCDLLTLSQAIRIFLCSHLTITHVCSGSTTTATLFEGHQLSLEYLVRNLLKLYVDIEFTGSHTQVCRTSMLSS